MHTSPPTPKCKNLVFVIVIILVIVFVIVIVAAGVSWRQRIVIVSSTRLLTFGYYRLSYLGLNVSPWRMSPVVKPFFSHLARWAEVPWLNESGTLYPRAFFCR